jgi:UDP-N-acetylglucosamine 2-epimerase
MVICGTRPEAIKLAPVVDALRGRREMEVVLVSTGQHRQMLDQAFADFELTPDIDLNLMRPAQGLSELLARLLESLADLFRRRRPDWVVVQGDTTTVLGASLAAFAEGIGICHVEAGLRTGDLRAPFPEEMNRRCVGILASRHCVPTLDARAHLLSEGVPPASIHLTGNTVIDALAWTIPRLRPSDLPIALNPGRRLVLLTMHRRESFGEPMRDVLRCMRQLLEVNSDLELVYPVHLNPQVRETVNSQLRGCERVHLLEPLSYRSVVAVLARSEFVLTDSGGIQEEAPFLGTPVLVLRDVSERPEAVRAGAAVLVGTDPQRIFQEAMLLLSNEPKPSRRKRQMNVFGDGRASARIADILTIGSPRDGEFTGWDNT